MWLVFTFMALLFGGREPDVSFGCLAEAAVSAGILFGLAMAGYYAYGRKKYNLPRWQDLERKP